MTNATCPALVLFAFGLLCVPHSLALPAPVARPGQGRRSPTRAERRAAVVAAGVLAVSLLASLALVVRGSAGRRRRRAHPASAGAQVACRSGRGSSPTGGSCRPVGGLPGLRHVHRRCPDGSARGWRPGSDGSAG